MLEFLDIKDYRDLRVWNLAVSLACEIHEINKRALDPEPDVVLTEARTAAVELATAIAKGFTIGSSEAFLEHLGIARGALAAAETRLLLAHRFGLVDDAACNRAMALVGEVGIMLRGLQKVLRRELAF